VEDVFSQEHNDIVSALRISLVKKETTTLHTIPIGDLLQPGHVYISRFVRYSDGTKSHAELLGTKDGPAMYDQIININNYKNNDDDDNDEDCSSLLMYDLHQCVRHIKNIKDGQDITLTLYRELEMENHHIMERINNERKHQITCTLRTIFNLLKNNEKKSDEHDDTQRLDDDTVDLAVVYAAGSTIYRRIGLFLPEEIPLPLLTSFQHFEQDICGITKERLVVRSFIHNLVMNKDVVVVEKTSSENRHCVQYKSNLKTRISWKEFLLLFTSKEMANESYNTRLKHYNQIFTQMLALQKSQVFYQTIAQISSVKFDIVTHYFQMKSSLVNEYYPYLINSILEHLNDMDTNHDQHIDALEFTSGMELYWQQKMHPNHIIIQDTSAAIFIESSSSHSNAVSSSSASPELVPLPSDDTALSEMTEDGEQKVTANVPATVEGVKVDKHVKAALHALFCEFDTIGVGYMTITELIILLDIIPKIDSSVSIFSKEDAVQIMNAFDADGNNEIDEDEFNGWILNGLTRTKEEREQFQKKSQTHATMGRLLNAMDSLIQKIRTQLHATPHQWQHVTSYVSTDISNGVSSSGVSKETDRSRTSKSAAPNVKSPSHMVMCILPSSHLFDQSTFLDTGALGNVTAEKIQKEYDESVKEIQEKVVQNATTMTQEEVDELIHHIDIVREGKLMTMEMNEMIAKEKMNTMKKNYLFAEKELAEMEMEMERKLEVEHRARVMEEKMHLKRRSSLKDMEMMMDVKKNRAEGKDEDGNILRHGRKRRKSECVLQ
jgi:hypothetical protein